MVVRIAGLSITCGEISWAWRTVFAGFTFVKGDDNTSVIQSSYVHKRDTDTKRTNLQTTVK